MESTEILLTVMDPSGNVVCQTTSGIRNALVANPHLIDIAACPSLPGNQYSITLTDPDHHSKDLLYDSQLLVQSNFPTMTSLSISRSDSSHPFIVTNGNHLGTIYVLYDLNPREPKYTPGQHGQPPRTDDSACQEDASPLVIDTTPFVDDGHGLPLTSPSLGVLFDILGQNSSPVADTKKRISWFRNPNYMFLVLPDQNGLVNGINQMFGNNTLGPDGEFAPNGFYTLGKYDANGDGVINSSDPIFASLRLWSDDNYDGVVQPGELHTLEEMGIIQIDLNYNAQFSEQDQFGNMTRFSSIVHYLSGQVRDIFDVWFAI